MSCVNSRAAVESKQSVCSCFHDSWNITLKQPAFKWQFNNLSLAFVCTFLSFRLPFSLSVRSSSCNLTVICYYFYLSFPFSVSVFLVRSQLCSDCWSSASVRPCVTTRELPNRFPLNFLFGNFCKVCRHILILFTLSVVFHALLLSLCFFFELFFHISSFFTFAPLFLSDYAFITYISFSVFDVTFLIYSVFHIFLPLSSRAVTELTAFRRSLVWSSVRGRLSDRVSDQNIAQVVLEIS
jgi:hypothetical protein